MKVVLFCGGLGMRMREYSEAVPKPMVPIGYRPILWHLMKYYAHHGHKDFILCLGYQADVIKKYFLNYDECITNDFVLSKGGQEVSMLSTDIDEWKMTFVDTGLYSNIGMRLIGAEKHLAGEEYFLANYSDGLSDLDINYLVDVLRKSGKTAIFVSVQPKSSFHLIDADDSGVVKRIEHIRKVGTRVNGGFFVFHKNIFNYIKPGEELVEQPFHRLIEDGQLLAYAHQGFWGCMDTFKEKQELDELFAQGRAPWTVWKDANSAK